MTLAPCPFCKSNTHLAVQEISPRCFAVTCGMCNAIGPHEDGGPILAPSRIEEAARLWNADRAPANYSVETIVL